MNTRTFHSASEISSEKIQLGADVFCGGAVFIPTVGTEVELVRATYLACLADPSPQARLIGELALRKAGEVPVPADSVLIYPSQADPVSGIDFGHHMLRQGPPEPVAEWVRKLGGTFHCRVRSIVSQVINRGGFAIVLANETVDLGVVYLRRVK